MSSSGQDIPLVHKSPLSPVLTHHSKFYTSSSGNTGRLRPMGRPRPRHPGSTIANKSGRGMKGLYIITSLELESQPEQTSLSSRSPSFRWLLVIYKILCIGVFSIYLWKFVGHPSHGREYISNQTPTPITSNFTHFEVSQLTSLRPVPISLDADILRPSITPGRKGLTACVWAMERELPHIVDWMAIWEGSISLLVVTVSAPSSPDRLILMERLWALHRKDTIQQLFVHLLYVHPHTSSPNAFLNFARLLSHTDYVILFPASIYTVPHPQLHSHLSKKILDGSARTPALFSDTGDRSPLQFPFSPLQPLLIDRTYPFWCSDRFFTSPSRDSDWKDCLWELWINSLGLLQTFPVPRSSSVRKDIALMESVTANDVIMHEKLSRYFRQETCLMAAKYLRDKITSGEITTTAMPWLRKACKYVS